MHTDSAFAIETTGLRKSFGSTRAVDGIDLRVRVGTIYGLLGPNGAGKTTTIRILSTLMRPDGGTARVLGHDVEREPDAVRRRISLTGQFASVDEDFSGGENLRLLARLLGFSRAAARSRAAELLEAFGIAEAADRQVRQYSGGMRRRLDIAASILRMPDLLFLDEPTTGLDPRSRSGVWEIIRTLVSAGTTVLLTTQYMEEADQLADRIAVVDHGRVIAEGTSADLKRQVGSGVLHVGLADPSQRDTARELLSRWFEHGVHEDGDPRALSAQLSDPGRAAPAITALTEAGIHVTDFSLGRPSLDEVFFALTGHTTGEHEVVDPDELGRDRTAADVPGGRREGS